MKSANRASLNLFKAATIVLGLGSVVPAASAQMMAGPAPSVVPADYEFVVRAAYSGWGEIAAAQTALRNSGDPRIRNLANMMIADHTAANQQLASIAASRGIAPTIGFGQPGHARGDAADERAGLDRAYLIQQVADHRIAIALFETEAASSPDPALRAFAQNTLPVLQRHLQMVSGAGSIASAR